MGCCFRMVFLILFSLGFSGTVFSASPIRSEDFKDLRALGINIIPRPAGIEPGKGFFTLFPTAAILVSSESKSIGVYLAGILTPATGYPLKVVSGTWLNGRSGSISFSLKGDLKILGDEGYQLQVLPDRILIKAAKPAGLFYGCQTLRQLFPFQIENPSKVTDVRWNVPVVEITDKPEFVWRGLMLDPARQFISKQGILKYIDLLAWHKLNRLHLHLNDDYWRVEIRKYPKLTQLGAFSDLGQGITIGGFYTQEDIREIVRYADSRFVTVIPEIETPSHAGAVMVAYPRLNCFGTRTKNYGWDPLCGSEYCPGNDSVFIFLEDVIKEVASIFTGPYIHIGGDEAEMKYWGVCPKCQNRIKEIGTDNLHGWFLNRVNKMVEANGKRSVGWNSVAKGAIHTCWDGDGSGGWRAAKNGEDVIMSPGNSMYIDYNIEVTSLKATYDFDPAPVGSALTTEDRKHILGTEATLWGEAVSEDQMDAQAFPRILALAERNWGIEKYDFEDFIDRVKVHVNRLERHGVLTGPAFACKVEPAIPLRIRNGLPSLIYKNSTNDEDWRWTLTGMPSRGGSACSNPLFAFDGDLQTYYLTWGPRAEFDAFDVLLEKPDTYDHIKVITGMPNGDHILRQGILEVSKSYGQWKEVARFQNGIAEAALDGSPVVEVRIRSTINQPPFALLAVREFILEKNGKSTLKELTPVQRLKLPAVLPE